MYTFNQFLDMYRANVLVDAEQGCACNLPFFDQGSHQVYSPIAQEDQESFDLHDLQHLFEDFPSFAVRHEPDDYMPQPYINPISSENGCPYLGRQDSYDFGSHTHRDNGSYEGGDYHKQASMDDHHTTYTNEWPLDAPILRHEPAPINPFSIQPYTDDVTPYATESHEACTCPNYYIWDPAQYSHPVNYYPITFDNTSNKSSIQPSNPFAVTDEEYAALDYEGLNSHLGRRARYTQSERAESEIDEEDSEISLVPRLSARWSI